MTAICIVVTTDYLQSSYITMLIDIHRHSSDKGKADKVLRNLFHNETDEMNATDFCSVGLHPWHVSEKSLANDLQKVDISSSDAKVFAIGECGIDKYINTNIEIQRKAFARQIDIAIKQHKPMIIHCVRAYDELQAFRKKANHKQPWIFHWYNAAPQTAFDLIEKGCYLSFGHMLFKEDSKAYKTFLKMPLEKVFLETDDAPVSIEEVYQQAAILKKISLAQLKTQIELNFKSCFGKI